MTPRLIFKFGSTDPHENFGPRARRPAPEPKLNQDGKKNREHGREIESETYTRRHYGRNNCGELRRSGQHFLGLIRDSPSLSHGLRGTSAAGQRRGEVVEEEKMWPVEVKVYQLYQFICPAT